MARHFQAMLYRTILPQIFITKFNIKFKARVFIQLSMMTSYWTKIRHLRHLQNLYRQENILSGDILYPTISILLQQRLQSHLHRVQRLIVVLSTRASRLHKVPVERELRTHTFMLKMVLLQLQMSIFKLKWTLMVQDTHQLERLLLDQIVKQQLRKQISHLATQSYGDIRHQRIM